MAKIKLRVPNPIGLVGLLFLTCGLSGSPLEAQSSEAAAAERLRWLERQISAGNKIGEDEVRTWMASKKTDQRLVQAMQESGCGQTDQIDCDTWLDAVAIRAWNRAERNNNKQIDPKELRDFEATLIWGDLSISDLLPEDAPQLPGVGDSPVRRSGFPEWLGTIVSIRRSFLDEKGASDPASITWTHFGGGDKTLRDDQRRTRFDIQAAISYEIGNERAFTDNWRWTPVLVIEGDVSTDETVARDSVIHRIGTQIYGERDIDAVWTAHFVDFTLDYKTDRDYRSEVLGATLQYTPNMPKIGVGAYKSLWGPLFFRWRPYLGLSYSDVRDPGNIASLQQSKGFTNYFVRARFESALGARLVAAAEGQAVLESEGKDETHIAYTASLRYLLDREGHTSLIVSYEKGEKPPKFDSKEQTRIGLGIKF